MHDATPTYYRNALCGDRWLLCVKRERRGKYVLLGRDKSTEVKTFGEFSTLRDAKLAADVVTGRSASWWSC